MLVTGDSFGCGSPRQGWGAVFQGFTPAAASLTRVVLRLRAGGAFPDAGTTSTLTVRADSPRAELIASAEAVVSGPRRAGEQIDVAFQLAATPLTPGRLYVIGWSSPPEGDSMLTWMSTGDTYPGGHAYDCFGRDMSDTDFVFATYAH